MLRFRALVLAQAVWLLFMSPAGAQHTKDSLEKVKENIAAKKAILIDVREPNEWNEGHLQAAQLVPLSDLKKASSDPTVQQKLDKTLPKQQIIYCHCRSGGRVLAAKGILSKLGYDIRPLAAGYDELIAAGFAPAKEKQ
jgi:rhodanese-related sulfurtransferase